MMLAALVAFLGVFYFAVQLEKGNKPPETMLLPDEASFGAPVVAGAAPVAGPLAIQHMGSREVSMKLIETVAEVLSFNRGDYSSVTASAQKYFTPEGYAQYREFLNNSSFESTLSEQNLQAGTYVDGNPLELASGVYNGVFKWMFEVPVTLSLIPRNADTYTNNATQPQNRKFLLRVQMARVNDPQDPHAVKIELWQVLPPRTR